MAVRGEQIHKIMLKEPAILSDLVIIDLEESPLSPQFFEAVFLPVHALIALYMGDHRTVAHTGHLTYCILKPAEAVIRRKFHQKVTAVPPVS